MRKGRTNLDRKGMLVFIPNNGKSSKVLKVTYPILKMAIALTLLLSIIAGLSYSLLYFINENKEIHLATQQAIEDYGREMSSLSTYLGRQSRLLDTRLNEMTDIEDTQQELSDRIRVLSNQLKVISDQYVDNITLASVSVSASNIAQFAKESKEIADALEILLETNEQTKDELLDFSKAAEVLNDYLDTIPTCWPTVSYRIASHFGMRDHPILNQYKQHTGVDLGGTYGDPIYATASGYVQSVTYEHSGYGYWLTLRHTQSISSLYAHCSRILVNSGDYVEKGQVIAYVGQTGLATGPHLHFEIRINNVPINPLLFVNFDN